MRYLAIDYGLKRTGLAVCDKDERICSPLKVLATDSSLIRNIVDIAQANAVEGLVVGLPFNMDGTEGEMAKAVRSFAGQLSKATPLPVHFHDERLTSHKAHDLLAPADFTRKRKKQRLDAVAAAALLESFLDSRRT